MHNPEIKNLIQRLSYLPGFGPRSGRRAALHLLKKKETHLKSLLDALAEAYEKVVNCKTCGNLDTQSPCFLCSDEKRDKKTLCVVENVSDLWAIERSNMFKGRYHILGGILSSMDGIGPSQLNIETLHKRMDNIEEVILSLSATVDGQTTLYYVSNELKKYKVKITTLAHGLPIGGELDYLDDGTLSAAFTARHTFD